MTSNLLCFNSARTEFLLLGPICLSDIKFRFVHLYSVMITLFILLPLLATLNSFLILILTVPISFLLSLVYVFTTVVIFVASALISTVIYSSTLHHFLYSRLDYCNTMYLCLPKSQIIRLQYAHTVFALLDFAALG